MPYPLPPPQPLSHAPPHVTHSHPQPHMHPHWRDDSESYSSYSSTSSSVSVENYPYDEYYYTYNTYSSPTLDYGEYSPSHHYATRDTTHTVAAGGANITVGPVIGLVTSTTARILCELPETTYAMCCLYDDQQRLASSTDAFFRAGIPSVFVFNDLSPEVKYIVKVDGWSHVNSSFRTFPTLPTLHNRLAFAVVACNKIRITKEKVLTEEPEGDVWNALAKECCQGSINMMLHVGDQVYGDDDYEAMEQGKVDVSVGMAHCVFARAQTIVNGTNPSQWEEVRQEVTELYRDAYRETWNHLPTKIALANCPSIMQYDDHEIRDDLGDKPDELNPSTATYFICTCARRTIMEYQRQLFEDIDLSHPLLAPPLQRENHFFAVFGDYGLLFVDSRGAKTFNRIPNDSYPFLTSPQWDEIEANLSERGVLSPCKLLIVCTQVPMLFFGRKQTERMAKKADDFEGMWTYKENTKELLRLLDLLETWQNRNPDRQVVLAGGDVHLAGLTYVYKNKRLMFEQIISGPISNVPIGKFVMMGTNFLKERGQKLGNGWHFDHHNWRNKRNYARIQTAGEIANPLHQADGRGAVYGQTVHARCHLSHVVAENGKNIECFPDPPAGKGKKCSIM
eukprot:TRINITY_DN59132_c0_g1_i1.p1 TRINITY_DN59132_c0_g1~~TRINITY_DN59132_c0_g1_i1.p1  ORF type:complete len:621 (+),score=69.59 TRINITY_DN59132_c0_g1_i1:161-2023(+)